MTDPRISAAADLGNQVLDRVGSVVIGKTDSLRLVLAAILAGGHTLLEDLPGLGKPIPDIDEPYDPMWWVKKWMKRENLSAEIAQGLRTLRER